MKIRIRHELLFLNLLVALLVVTSLLAPVTAIRFILGVPLVLFFPGYVLVAALFPGKDRLSGMERVALSCGLSIAIVPLVGLILNYTPWGITLESILYALSAFILIVSFVA